MTALVLPDVRWFPSWAATVREFDDVEHVHAAGFWNLDGRRPPLTEEGLADFVRLLESTTGGTPDGTWVPNTYFWITAADGGPGDEVIGFLHVRHELNDFLLEEDGHIGYGVRPSARGQGHATRALALAVEYCAELGIERALVTCDEDNEPSRRTIERCGGVFEDVRGAKRRYWIDAVRRTARKRPASGRGGAGRGSR